MRGSPKRRHIARALVLVSLPVVASVASATGSALEQRGVTTRVSVSTSGDQGDGRSYGGELSPNGRFVVFGSRSTNLVDGQTDARSALYLRDRVTGTTEPLLTSKGEPGDGLRHVAFTSSASNIVEGDTNEVSDVFVLDRVAGTTERVSLTDQGQQANGVSAGASLSSDGRYVVFSSAATNLVKGDTNQSSDVFVRDRVRGITRRISISSAEQQGNQHSFSAVVSGDGRFVAFMSAASNLSPEDPGRNIDVYLRDRTKGITRLVTVGVDGHPDGASNGVLSMSKDGRFVAFGARARNLVKDDTNGRSDIFVWSRLRGTTRLVSVSSDEKQANRHTGYYGIAISANGRYIAFSTGASNLVARDTNDVSDVFVRDRVNGTTERVSVGRDGVQGIWGSQASSISADGRSVAFQTLSPNLVDGDTNQSRDVFIRDRWPE
jgi:hypothetical protein